MFNMFNMFNMLQAVCTATHYLKELHQLSLLSDITLHHETRKNFINSETTPFRKRNCILQRLKEYNDFNDVTYGHDWLRLLLGSFHRRSLTLSQIISLHLMDGGMEKA